MPANPLTPQQLAEAAALKSKFVAWQDAQRAEKSPWSQAFASKSLGFGQSAMNQYLNGKIPLNPDAANKFAKLIGCSVKDFSETIAREISAFAFDVDRPKMEANTEPGPEVRGYVPLLSDVQAGMFKEFIDNFHPGDGGIEPIPVVTVPVNRYTFALRVVGDSMEPRFPEGTLLIVEPEMEPNPGDFVIAKNGSEETTFKQLTKDGADWYLKPLNERYPIKPLGRSTIIGVVRAVELRLR